MCRCECVLNLVCDVFSRYVFGWFICLFISFPPGTPLLLMLVRTLFIVLPSWSVLFPGLDLISWFFILQQKSAFQLLG